MSLFLNVFGLIVLCFGLFLTFQQRILGRVILNIPKGGLIAMLGILLLTLPATFFFAEPGYQYFVVNPLGHKSAVITEGLHYKTPFSLITPWQKYIDVKVVNEETPKDVRDEIEGGMKPINIRFSDQVVADMSVSIRFELPMDEEQFIDLAIKFRSMQNLVYNTLIPTIQEQGVNAGYMYTAQDYISGSAQSFRQTFEEMLKEGAYAVKKTEENLTIYEDSDIDKPTEKRKVKEIQTRYRVEKILDEKTQKPIRIPHEITDNQIIVSQVIVDDVNLDSEYKDRLKEQKGESAKRQLEQQKIETARIAQQRIAAEGERDKAQERAKQEIQQVQQLIDSETQLKKQETLRLLAEKQLATGELEAKKQKVMADATFYENSRRVQAGLTPQERAQFEKETRIGIATQLKDLKFPQLMIIGSDGKQGGTALDSLIGAAMAKQLLNDQ